MPTLRYHENDNIYALPRMASGFSDSVIALQRLKMMQQRQQLEDYYRNIETGMQQQRLGAELPKLQAETERLKLGNEDQRRTMGFQDQLVKGVQGMNDPMAKVPGGVGPPNPQDVYLQNVRVALAALASGSPSSAQRMTEGQQFRPGPVYDPSVGYGGPQQPMFNAPPSQEGEYQRQMMVQRKNEEARRFHQNLMSIQERIRHDKAMEAKTSKVSGIDQLLQDAIKKRQVAPTNSAPQSSGRFKITPLD